MKLNSNDVLIQLERLGAAFPWDTVNIWLIRKPEGQVTFTIYVESNDNLGLSSSCSSCIENLVDGVDTFIRDRASDRDPEIARQRKIVELQEKLAKLQAAVFNFPPYRPNRELAMGSIVQNNTIEV